MTREPNFDSLAGPYRWLEYLTFGPFLWRARAHFLPALADCRSALVLGDGDGRFTAELLRRNVRIRVHAVDLSPAMLSALAFAARRNASRLVTEVADLRLWGPDANAGYGLIVSHFFLDCLTTGEVASLARRLAPACAPKTLWLISDFAIPQTRFGRWIAAPLVAGLYAAFGWFTGLRVRALPGHGAALATAGWSLRGEKLRLRGLLCSQLWENAAARQAIEVAATAPPELQ